MHGNYRIPAGGLLGLLLLFSLYACSPGPHGEYVSDGQALFQEYCASCHGSTGLGDGPVAAELDTVVPDLTLMKSRYEGVFPTEYFLRTIDGRQEFLAHGTRGMPIWGNIWRPGQEDSFEDEIVTQRTLNGLLYYVESIQK